MRVTVSVEAGCRKDAGVAGKRDLLQGKFIALCCLEGRETAHDRLGSRRNSMALDG
jgi:hypothetical protein